VAVSRVGGCELSLACSSVTAKTSHSCYMVSMPTCTATMAPDTPTRLAALKQTFAHRLLRELRAQAGAQTNALWSTPVAVGHVWQRRFYDFVVFSDKKRVEKLRYMHRNPIERGLVLKPEEWLWSSFRHYAYGERGPVLVSEARKAELLIRKIS
jgi:hypothetical protein